MAKINQTKFERPDITALIPELLESLDISTNMYMMYYYETSHMLPLQNTNSFHPTMGFIVSSYPDISNTMELSNI